MRTLKGLFFRSLIVLTMILFFHAPMPVAALDINGLITENTRWSEADSPVNVTGDIRIDRNASLTIDPGVRVVFRPRPDTTRGYRMQVDGTLVARGTAEKVIVFTAENASIPWGSIFFSDTSKDWNANDSSGCIVEYCLFEYGGNDVDHGGMIATLNAMPLITLNAIRSSQSAGIAASVSDVSSGIVTLSGAIQIISNQIYNNQTGIRFSAEGGVIQNNYFLGNSRAIDLQVRSNNVRIEDNTVVSAASELFGTGIRMTLDQPASGIAQYNWTQVSGTPVTLQNALSPTPYFTAPNPGNALETLVFRLTVNDRNNQQSSATVAVTVVGSNPPPVANAGSNVNVRLPQTPEQQVTVSLNGISSYDPNTGIAGYQWAQTQGTAVTLTGADTVNPHFIVPATVVAGERMTFQLTVRDQGGLTSTDTVDVLYYNNNIYPIADAGADRAVFQGQTVVLDGAGSADPDGGIAAYSWRQTGGPEVALVNPDTSRPFFVAPTTSVAGQTLTFELIVTDIGGLQMNDNVTLTLNGKLVADPGDAQTVFFGQPVVLDGSGSVDQNAVAAIDIDSNIMVADNASAGLIAMTAEQGANFQLNMMQNNFNAIQQNGYLVYAYDWAADPMTIAIPGNWWGTDQTRVIESLIYDQSNDYKLPIIDYMPIAEQALEGVGSDLTYPALANAGDDQETSADNTVILDGGESFDPSGSASYHWEQIEGPTVMLKNADQRIASFNAPLGGAQGTTLRFQLTVSTGGPFTQSDTVDVRVLPDQELSTVDVGGCFMGCIGKNLNNGFSLPTALLGVGLLAMSAVTALRRKGFLVLCLLLIGGMTFIAMPVQAGYLVAGGGAGGEAEEFNVTIETGAKDIRAGDLNLLFGIGIPFIPHSDREFPTGTLSFPSPNPDSLPMESVRKGTEIGLLGKLGLEIGSSDFYVSVLGGFTAFTESELSRSPITGRVYEESSDSKIEPLYGGGISYFLDYKWPIVLQVDYDNVRGVTGTIGWYW